MQLINAGFRFAKDKSYGGSEYHVNKAPKRARNKAARRLIRGGLKRAYSSIERSIMKASAARLERESLASNSHEAKRYADAREVSFPVARGAKANTDALKAFASRG